MGVVQGGENGREKVASSVGGGEKVASLVGGGRGGLLLLVAVHSLHSSVQTD